MRSGGGLRTVAGGLLALTAWASLARSGRAAPGGPELARRLLEEETRSGGAWSIVAHLTDAIGPRLSGSAGAEAAVRWTAERLRQDGFAPRLEPVTVPHWVRGEEQAEITAPGSQRLVVTALGGSVPTPEGGVEAEVVEALGLEDLPRLGEAVRGRIVLFNRAMASSDFEHGYADAVPQRTRGAAEAGRLGAVATLVRSLGTLAARLPHTGALRYEPDVPAIPSAALTAEDADLVHRRLAAGERVRVRLRLGCRTLPDAPSANVVADLVGRERPEEIVLLAAHLDSWDLGTGAIDDGGGVAMVMETLRLLRQTGFVPRRTVRAVLYMNEENGLRGANTYAAAHAAELSRHVAAIETDSGVAPPEGFRAWVGPGGIEALQEVTAALHPLGAERLRAATDGGADISPLKPAGVPLLGLDVDPSRYFHWHHTAADTLDKVDRDALAKDTVALAVAAYLIAERREPLPRPTPPPASPVPSAPPSPRP